MQVAILCYGDLVLEFVDEMLPHVDGTGATPKPSESALAQLLLKSVSKDKKFVLEASQKVLDSCAQTLEPVQMSQRLLEYLKHKYASTASSLVLRSRIAELCLSFICRECWHEICLVFRPSRHPSHLTMSASVKRAGMQEPQRQRRRMRGSLLHTSETPAGSQTS